MLAINGTLLILFLSFMVFIFLMQKILYSPVLNIQESRNKYIRDNFEDAENIKKNESDLIDDYDDKIASAHSRANSLISNKMKEANSKKDNIIKETQEELNAKKEQVLETIEQNKQETRQTLRGEVVSLAHSISEKILGENVPISSISEEVIDEALKSE